MCSGLILSGVKMIRLESDKVVVVMVEGKEYVVVVGMIKMFIDEM